MDMGFLVSSELIKYHIYTVYSTYMYTLHLHANMYMYMLVGGQYVVLDEMLIINFY